MIAKTDLAKLYETLLSIPGMNNQVKIEFKIPLRNALLLSKIIDRGLSGKETDDSQSNILDLVNPDLVRELAELPKEILQKSGLMEMNEKLMNISVR